MQKEQKEKIREEFIQKCFDADKDAFLSIPGEKAVFIANWFLSKFDTLLEEKRKLVADYDLSNTTNDYQNGFNKCRELL